MADLAIGEGAAPLLSQESLDALLGGFDQQEHCGRGGYHGWRKVE
jgi:hypothetical protein